MVAAMAALQAVHPYLVANCSTGICVVSSGQPGYYSIDLALYDVYVCVLL